MVGNADNILLNGVRFKHKHVTKNIPNETHLPLGKVTFDSPPKSYSISNFILNFRDYCDKYPKPFVLEDSQVHSFHKMVKKWKLKQVLNQMLLEKDGDYDIKQDI